MAEAIIETLQSTKQNVLIQRFVKESKGRDIRALVVGDRVVAAMRRVAQGDEFRSNVHRGGSVEPVELAEDYEATAVRSAQIMGLKVAGVDMLEGNDGPQVMEVNSSPGLEGIETATKLDVAGAIIDHIDNQVAFPQIDVRQRLSISTGYGVAELAVHEGADMVGRSIGESGLRERDITVLTLHRGAPRDPQPAGRHPAGGRGPAALLRQPRGDALDDPRAPQAPAAGQEAAEAADPRRLTRLPGPRRRAGRRLAWLHLETPLSSVGAGRDVDRLGRVGDGHRASLGGQVPAVQREHRDAGPAGQRDLAEGAPAAAHRHERVDGADQQRVAQLAEAGRQRQRQVGVALAPVAAREQAEGRAAGRLGTTRGGRHHAGAAARSPRPRRPRRAAGRPPRRPAARPGPGSPLGPTTPT